MSNNLYPITYWYGIRKEFLSRERLKEAREAGFNLIECAYDTETNLRVLALCAELGLRANVQDPRMSIALLGEPGWEAELDAMIADYRDCPALNRFFVRDEPTDDYFPTLGRVVDYLHAHDPVHGEYINLLPSVAVMPLERYQAHIDGFLRTVHPQLLSYDHYNLMWREVPALDKLPAARVSDENRKRNGWEGKLFEAYDRAGYYDNMEMIRASAARAGIPWMTIILLVEHWGYRWPTEGEVRWEAFNALTYGSTGLSYFTYWTPGANHSEPWSYHNGIILSDGTRGEKYEIVKRINRELQALYRGLVDPLPGESMECTYEAAANEKVAFATMFGYSNDWFFANGPELNALTKGDVTSKTVLLDDGTAVSQYPGAGNAQSIFGGTLMPEDKAISAVGDTYPVPAVDGIVKITIY